MRYLGLDLGDKTLGIAISRSGIIVQAYETVRHDNDYHKLKNRVKAIVELEKIDIIVLGYPKNMDDSIGERCKKSEKFKKILENEGLNVVLEDERLTTVTAEKILVNLDISRKKRKGIIDSLAAQIILEDYLKGKDNGR